jgi:GDP-L-fucose synthase
MKIWLTGASGSLGKELLVGLHKSFPDIEILCPGRYELDLENTTQVKNYVEKHRPTHVFHLAAKVYGIQGHLNDPIGSLVSNTFIDSNVFGALFMFPPEWIYYSSSVAAYGYPYKSLPLSEADWLNGSPHPSEYGYAMAKRHAVSYLEILANNYDTKYVYGLTTNLFGYGDRFHDGRGHVVVSLLKKAVIARKDHTPLVVWGSGEASRDFLSTTDASQLLIELLNSDSGIVNIASGQEIEIKEIALDIARVFQIENGIQFTSTNEGIARRVCSTDKLLDSVKVKPRIDSKAALLKQINDFYLQNFPQK